MTVLTNKQRDYKVMNKISNQYIRWKNLKTTYIDKKNSIYIF